ncbi:aminomethyltransferase family protein [Pseudonocardia halophobica]|uniref:Glycine cleavage system protein T n=1 Tax=Pseudonocardia halophobica TaxID=29401 RepID=A0A9W6L7F7_9PSEU|nr:aminomethyltransferase family protein [Pseudonocardia halophobica]GLL14497.1 glycine cleavage system protein T [Pseudonocardia halophobica]
MAGESLEAKIARLGGPVRMLRHAPHGPFKSKYPLVHSNWQEEQEAISKTAVLFDQSHHMTDVRFRGPDVTRLLTDTGTNSFATYGPGKAKHLVVCTEDGLMVGTTVLFGLGKEEASLVGPAGAANWVQFQAETGGYNVEVLRDERTEDNVTGRRLYRYEIGGPEAWNILEKVNGGALPFPKFFTMTELTIAGRRVQGLFHTVIGKPGSDSKGMEIFGPAEDGPAVLDALLTAGAEFGLVRAGGIAYYTGATETGYPAQPLPAIYTSERTKAFREWLPGDWYEGKLSIGGSYASEDVEDYYVSPYDFGYGHLVRFDHDFIGREALERDVDRPHRKKVWLIWNDDDVVDTYRSSLFDGENRAKSLETPLPRYARVPADAVMIGDRRVGMSTMAAYTVNFGCWFSVAFLDEAEARDGAEVTLLWGEEDGGTGKRNVEYHRQRPIRCTVRTERR